MKTKIFQNMQNSGRILLGIARAIPFSGNGQPRVWVTFIWADGQETIDADNMDLNDNAMKDMLLVIDAWASKFNGVLWSY